MNDRQIKAVIFDYDDTLYSHKNEEIPSMTQEALKALKADGYILGLCTSRFPFETKSFPAYLDDEIDAWMEGTGCLLKKGNEWIVKKTIAQDTAEEIIAYFEKEKIPYLWITEDLQEHFSRKPDAKILKHIAQWQESIPTDQAWAHEPLLNITFYDVNEVQMAHINAMSDRVRIERWGMTGQINAKGIDKAYGLREFAKAFHLDVKQIAVFGDGANDISMIDEAGVGIAVGNANEELQRHAAYITGSIEEGGIYQACLKYGWIKNAEGIHIIFFDIDGTTYQNNICDLPASGRRTLQQLKQNGFKLVIDTSRSQEEMSLLPKDFIPMMDAVIINAGGQIVINGRTTYRFLSEEHTAKAIDLMNRNGIVYRWVDEHSRGYLSSGNPDIGQKFYRLYSMIPPVKQWNGEKLINLLYYTNDEKLIKEIDDIFSSEVHTHFGFGHEQTPHSIDKARAMEIVCAAYGYTLENAAAFGDGANDESMIKAAKIGVAMGNACDACKEAADYVTDNIEDDGLYKACVQFGWIAK